MKFGRNKRLFVWVSVVLLLSVSLIAGGCEPLRKKFTRQKKKDLESSAFVPILDPIDYPEKVYSPAQDYKQHYSMWQVWQREFLNSLDEASSPKSSVKQELYQLDQLIVSLQAMQKLLVPEKEPKLPTLIAQFQSLKRDIEEPGLYRNTGHIKLKAELLCKQVREGYRFNRVKDKLVDKSEIPSAKLESNSND